MDRQRPWTPLLSLFRWPATLPIKGVGVLLVGMVLLAWLFLKAPSDRIYPTHTTTQLRMGTLVSITTWNVEPRLETSAVKQAFAEIDRVETAMSLHRQGSEIATINHVSRETPTPLSDELGRLMALGLEVGRHSGGAFAMDLQPLTALWGFSSETSKAVPPSEEALAHWLRHYPKGGGLVLKQEAQRLYQLQRIGTGIGLDLGGIAKGYAIDRAIEVLRRVGVTNAMVNAGGDIRVLGSKGGKPWRIGLQHPRERDRVVAVSELMGDRAMVTSGDYERFYLHEGVRYHHILDPRTGKPSRSGLHSVSIQAASAALADALSTAIFVMGAERGWALLAQFPGCEALLITDTGQHQRSSGFIGAWLGTP